MGTKEGLCCLELCLIARGVLRMVGMYVDGLVCSFE